MITENKLCLAFVRYIFSFKNKRHYVLVLRPPMKVIHFFQTFILNYRKEARHRNDIPSNVNMIKLRAATRQ